MAVKDVSLADALLAKRSAETDIGMAIQAAVDKLIETTGLVSAAVDVRILVHSDTGRVGSTPDCSMVADVKLTLAKPW